MAEETEENKINLNLDFESIVPWNGQQDTGRDVRLKLDRNWKKIVDAFNTLLNGEFLDDKYLRKGPCCEAEPFEFQLRPYTVPPAICLLCLNFFGLFADIETISTLG